MSSIQTFENAANWGSKIILQDLAKIMPAKAKQDSAAFFSSCSQIVNKARLLLMKLENYEIMEKKQEVYMQTESTVALYKYYAEAKSGQQLQRIMTEAYAFVAYLRKWITSISIDYLVAVEGSGKQMQVLHLTLKDIIDSVNLGVSSHKGFRLSLSPMKMTKQRVAEAKHFQNFEKDLQDIENNLIQILQQVTVRAKKDERETRRVMHEYGIKGKKLNKGFVTETAVNMYAYYGLQAKSIVDPERLAMAYISTVGNLPGFRGGDIDEETAKRFLKQEGENFKRHVEFQVKRISGIFGASVIEINTLKYELFNIYFILNSLKTQGPQQIKEKLLKYFTSSSKTAYDVSKEISKQLNITLQKTLSETINAVEAQLK